MNEVTSPMETSKKKSLETIKESYNRLPDERDEAKMKNYNERSHVEGNEILEKTAETVKQSYNRLPDERNDKDMEKYNERSHVEGNQQPGTHGETVKESYNRIPDEPVQETSVHEKYKSTNE